MEQKQRGIIQGQYYIYVTPFMLRVYLLKDWWEVHGLTKDGFNEFIESIPEEFRSDLLQRFFDNIPYIAATERGKDFTKAILGEGGVFADGSILRTKLGADFFLKLTEADPESALKCLKRTIGTWSKDELLQFTTGRREVVWALEKIAIWRHLFLDAARLLLALGEAENEKYSNNASGVFAQLFSPGRGPVATTEASPQERFPILKKTLECNSKERRILALQACNQALESEHFFRMVGAEYQGLRREPELWTPKTCGEIFDAYRQVWQLLQGKLDNLPPDEQQQVVDILIGRARGLGRIQPLADMVIDTLTELGQKPYGNAKKVLEEVVRILHYEGKNLPEETRQRWELLKNELTGNDFSSLMKRYVGMNLLEDEFDEQGNRVDLVQPRIEDLAKQATEKTDLLQPELDWLVTTKAQNGYRFGYELGKRDKELSLLPILLEAQQNADENASVFFLGGYFRSLFEKNQRKWEEQLDAFTEDKKLNTWIPELTWRSGMSDRAALRILYLAQKGIIGIGHFRMFGLGSVIHDLSGDAFKKWIEYLLNSTEVEAVRIALDLYDFYYLGKESKRILPKKLTLELLIHPLLFQKSEENRHNVMIHFHWAEIGKAFVNRYPEASLEIADKMLEHFGEDGTIVEGFHSESQAVLNEITQRYPQEIWQKVAKYLGPPIDSRAYHIKEWLRGSGFFDKEEGTLSIFPLEKIWEWVDEDVEKRARYIATFVPKTLFRKEGKICLAREVLVCYGKREDVRNSLMANFSTEGWSGPASLHYQRKKQHLLDFKEDEDNENVKQWIDEYVALLDWEIEQAEIEEERLGL